MEQNQLLVVAIAHHRFMHMHPFDNGNGRMGRLLNYAFLIKLGFNVKTGRIINPSSVFYADRDRYYKKLSLADSLQDEDVLNWVEYFLSGLRNEIKKIDNLMSRTFVSEEILIPTIKYALERENITKLEFEILNFIVKSRHMVIKSSDLSVFGIETSQQKSLIMKKLKDRGMISSIEPGGRIYTIKFSNNYLLRGIMHILDKKGFVADFLNSNI